jgi:hypothetical protein
LSRCRVDAAQRLRTGINDARLGMGYVVVKSDCEMQQAPDESSERQCRAGEADDTG